MDPSPCKIGVRSCVLLTLHAVTRAGPHQPVQPPKLLCWGQRARRAGRQRGWARPRFPKLFSSLYPLSTLNVRLGAHRKRRGLRLGWEGETSPLTTKAGGSGPARALKRAVGHVWTYKGTSVFNPSLCNRDQVQAEPRQTLAACCRYVCVCA